MMHAIPQSPAAAHSALAALVRGAVTRSARVFSRAADPLILDLDAGAVALEPNGPIQKSARGIWMRYDYDRAGWEKWCR